MSKTTEPTPQEPLGDSEGTATPAVVGLEPVHWYLENEDEYMSEKLRKEHERLNSYTFKLCKVAHPLYSAATVERLVQERNGWIDSAREFSNGLEYYRDQLDACARHIGLPCFTADDGGVHEEPLRAKVAEEVGRLVREREHYKAQIETQRLVLVNHHKERATLIVENDCLSKSCSACSEQLAAMTKKADGFFYALQLAAKINAEGQAREQQLREALKALQQGFPQTHQINAVIRHALVTPQDDTALRQWGAKLLRGMAEMDCFNDYMRERINRKADELEAGK